jgi:ABC-2 type transport system permease protein
MTRKRIRNILRKEWAVMGSSLNNTLFVTLLPLLITGQALLFIWLIPRFAGEGVLESPMFQAALEKLREALPSLEGLPLGEQFQVFLLQQFNFYLLLIPTMIAISFATFSIVEEKQARSLEPLLATPVRTWELLLGKALSGAIPALLITWICGGIFLLGVVGLGWGPLLGLVLTPSWLITLFLLTPAVAILSFLLGVVGSSRASDPKSAQNIAVLVVLPVLALIGVQITGIVWFTPPLTLALALGIGVIDLLMLRELGLGQQPQAKEMVEQSIQELFERGWLVGEEWLSVTDVGRKHLHWQMRGTRGEVHRWFG